MKTKYWILLLAAVVCVCLALALFLPRGGDPATHAQIICDGNLDRTVDLKEDQQFTVSCEGGYNIITVKDGKIAVTEADCPDRYCVRQGFCDSGVEIVCLPHGLVIRFTNDNGIDGAVG